MLSTYNNAVNAYSRASENQSGVKQVARLYDNIYHKLHAAKDARMQGRFEDEYKAVGIVIQALTGMRARLNYKKGMHVAVSLNKYYTNLILQLNYRYKAKDKYIFYTNIIYQVAIMRSAWVTLAGEPSSYISKKEIN